MEYYYNHSIGCGVKDNGGAYAYIKDIQENIEALIDSNENVVVGYKYDS